MDQVVWGMIGCGSVTEFKSGPAFNKLENSSLIAVMCRHIDSAQDYAFRHKIPFYFNDAEQIISNPLINAVYIATPVKFHAPYAIQAMEAGKAVYIEKPMALNYKQCLELKEVSNKTGSKLFVAYYRRSMDYFIKIKELINDNRIGTIESVYVSLIRPARKEDFDSTNPPWRVIPEMSGGGYFFDLACHQIDILQFLLGPISSASGKAENKAGLYPAEDTVIADWTFDCGIKGSGNWSFVSQKKDNQDIIIIKGTKGSLEFATFGFTPIILKQNNYSQLFNIKPPVHFQMPFIKSIVNELTNKAASDANIESAINTSKIMEEIIYNKRFQN